ncbi:unnamed protein product [Pieris macdunnoughi]|uniref:DDE Tnp4 domain-containing protein n=1 Tax=Pieris macdunnoughi TaxID=345717 RepID=A0A821UKB4_9NEOP|nr:unnamed protein product [Pieris macdunnoughi]
MKVLNLYRSLRRISNHSVALKYLALPCITNEKWKTIAEDFEGRSHFPHCLGGKHIRIKKFTKSGSMNLNYKFIFVNIGSYGKDCDAAIFQRTQFYKLLSEGRLQIPTPSLLHPNQSVETPYVLEMKLFSLLTHNLLRPYSGNQLTIQQCIFNYRLIRARRYVECAFGILANKCRNFHRPLNVSKKLGKNIVKACVVLHNLVRVRDGYRSADGYVATETAFVDLPDSNVVQGGQMISETTSLSILQVLRDPCRDKCLKYKTNPFISEFLNTLKISRTLSVAQDSKLASELSFGRTKAHVIVANVTGKVAENQLIDILQRNKFSLIVDENTDR